MLSFLAGLGRRVVSTGLAAASPATERGRQGLISIQYEAQAERPVEAILEVLLAETGKRIFRKTLQLGPEPAAGWFALHSHLLSNGPHAFVLRLTQGGKVSSEAALTIQVRNEGPIAEQVRASLTARATPLITEVCDSRQYDYADPSLAAWFDRTPDEIEAYLAGLAAEGRATAEEIAALRHFAENGYVVLPDRVDAGLLERLNAALDDAVAARIEGYEWGSSQRMHNLHHHYPAIRELWLDARIMRMLELIFGVPAKPCQSLTYVFGSQQEHHQDTIHLTPFPAGRMCGVWTALEDVQPDSGGLMVFPKSQRLPRVYMGTLSLAKTNGDFAEFAAAAVPYWTDLIVSNRLGPFPYRPKAGETLIWHENLMHAGSPRLDMSKSRRSIVGHYFAGGAIAYYDASGLPGELYEGEPA